MDKKEIYKTLTNKLKNKLKISVLKKNIDDLVEEYIEKTNLLKTNTLSDLPTKDEIYEFFIKDSPELVDNGYGIKEESIEIKIDEICLDDKIAYETFKFGYKEKMTLAKTKNGKYIKSLLNLYNRYLFLKNNEAKDKYRIRLCNIALVGSLRFEKIATKPYLCDTLISNIIYNFFKNLELLKQKKYNNEVYLFDITKRVTNA